MESLAGAMAAEQDRRTRMIQSSVNAPAKKGGAGGSYTWGSALDVQDFQPIGVDVASVGVVTAPTTTYVQAAPAAAYQYQQQAFPTLGAQPVTRVVNSSWGPTASAGPQVLAETSLRAGAIDVVDAQHPRNLFAKKPYTTQRTASVQVATQAQAGMIDWTQAGLPQGVVQSIVQSNAAAAHLGPYGTIAPAQVPLTTLRAQNVGAQQVYQQLTPQVARPVITNQRTIAGGIKQPQ